MKSFVLCCNEPHKLTCTEKDNDQVDADADGSFTPTNQTIIHVLWYYCIFGFDADSESPLFVFVTHYDGFGAF